MSIKMMYNRVMSKKSKKSKKKTPKAILFFKSCGAFIWSKKIIFGSGLLAACVIAVVFTICLRRANSAAQQNVNVAFYNIPEKQAKVLEDNIKKVEIGKVTFKNVSLDDLNKDNAAKTYDLLFTYEGLASEGIKAKAANISSKLFNYLPTSLRRQNEPNDRKSIPLVLDHFEFSYSKPKKKKIGVENPQNFDEMLTFLEKAKKYTFTPFFTNGGDDEILLGLISAIIEAKGGYNAYSTFVEAAKKTPSAEKLMALNLGNELTLQSVLDLFRSWQESGIIHPNWFHAKYRDILAFVEDGQVALLFTKLSVHRTIPYKLIRDFSTERAPVLSGQTDHALIAPALCAVKLSKKSVNDKVIQKLLTEETQTALSMGTQLAPVALRGESFDVQADDVRFFAASCRYGARTDLLSAAFMPDSEAAKKLCQEIRRYLTTGRI